jgi:hypothetical protein
LYHKDGAKNLYRQFTPFQQGIPMKKTQLTLPELAMIAGTRVMLGGGLGLLLSDRLGNDRRKVVGKVLFLAGALTTLPLAFLALSRRR